MNSRSLFAWALVILGIAALVWGLFVGVEPFELTLALVVIGIVAIAAGAFLLMRARRPS